MTNDIIANERISASTVRLVDTEGRQSDIVSLREALRRAYAVGLDLVLVAHGDVPVCRILDLDRHRYERAKAERDAARRQREMRVETKEIQLRPVTGEGDLAVKARRAREFLVDGDKVKVVVRFRGRERAHRDEGHRVLSAFLGLVGEHRIDSPARDGDRDTIMVLGPTISKSDLRKKV